VRWAAHCVHMQMDVQDCYEALEHAIECEHLDQSRIVVTGGSHGGWLTGHLIGQYPGLFKAAAARNPVLSLPEMAGVRSGKYAWQSMHPPYQHCCAQLRLRCSQVLSKQASS
jgi:dipeptidyl aminopeptidase/acylaminoacyl peptidase